MTDDQDLHMESVEHMPFLKAAHNHNVTSVAPPHGGYPKVVTQGINDDNLFLWMQEAGYNTDYSGKLWNFHTVDNYDQPYANGFNGSDFLLDPFTYQYWNGKISHNNEEPVSIANQYSTDVIAQRAVSWLHEALEADRPFFLTVSPIAPHSNWIIDEEKDLSYLEEPKPAPRHQHLFKDYEIPRSPSFNKAIDGAPNIDPTIKNLQWGDFIRGLLEAQDRQSQYPFLTDGDVNITEVSGYN
ncbi:arylsulfatase, partial [Fusarium albosuccineum]